MSDKSGSLRSAGGKKFPLGVCITGNVSLAWLGLPEPVPPVLKNDPNTLPSIKNNVKCLRFSLSSIVVA